MRKAIRYVLVAGLLGGLGAAGVYASQNIDFTAGSNFLNAAQFGNPMSDVTPTQEVRYDIDTSDKERLFKKAPKTTETSLW